MLFVRAPISSRRGSAIAGIACGLPVIAYSGSETAPPITDAGVVLVSRGNSAELGEALAPRLVRRRLPGITGCERSRQAQRKHFSWDAIAERYVRGLEPTGVRLQRHSVSIRISFFFSATSLSASRAAKYPAMEAAASPTKASAGSQGLLVQRPVNRISEQIPARRI